MGQLLFFGLLQRLSRTCRVNESPPWADARRVPLVRFFPVIGHLTVFR